ncbi:DUF6894 family protein [Bradyrhizobium viridifuturi]|uniref:DUF6894 family protein n=1 Tax=Bradyrhizobium viridifuturi TaxID=1654716 RepID=UPI003221F4EB
MFRTTARYQVEQNPFDGPSVQDSFEDRSGAGSQPLNKEDVHGDDAREALMRTYYFDMKDGVPARDRVGLAFASDADAIRHSELMAKQIRDRQPIGDVDRHIVIVDDLGKEIHRQAIYPGGV